MIVRVPLSVSIDLADWEVRYGPRMTQGEIRRKVKRHCMQMIEEGFGNELIKAEARLFYINEGKRK